VRARLRAVCSDLICEGSISRDLGGNTFLPGTSNKVQSSQARYWRVWTARAIFRSVVDAHASIAKRNAQLDADSNQHARVAARPYPSAGSRTSDQVPKAPVCLSSARIATRPEQNCSSQFESFSSGAKMIEPGCILILDPLNQSTSTNSLSCKKMRDTRMHLGNMKGSEKTKGVRGSGADIRVHGLVGHENNGILVDEEFPSVPFNFLCRLLRAQGTRQLGESVSPTAHTEAHAAAIGSPKAASRAAGSPQHAPRAEMRDALNTRAAAHARRHA
jgi:hypothetical protein